MSAVACGGCAPPVQVAEEVATLRRPPALVEVLDYEIECVKDRLAQARRRADKRALKIGARDINADRVVEWAEVRLAHLRAARAQAWNVLQSARSVCAEGSEQSLELAIWGLGMDCARAQGAA
jgi:hypothetical protein